MHAADARALVDNGDRRQYRLGQGQNLFAKQSGKPFNGFLSARRAQVDRGASVDDGLCVGPAARKAALRTLRLWQQVIDFFNQVAAVGRQQSCCKAQGKTSE